MPANPFRRRPPATELVAESGRARLVREPNGMYGCVCPYACDAVGERCNFTDHPKFAAQQRKHERRRNRAIRRTVRQMRPW